MLKQIFSDLSNYSRPEIGQCGIFEANASSLVPSGVKMVEILCRGQIMPLSRHDLVQLSCLSLLSYRGHETDNPLWPDHGVLIALTALNWWLCEALPLSLPHSHTLSLVIRTAASAFPDYFSAFGLAAVTEAVSK